MERRREGLETERGSKGEICPHFDTAPTFLFALPSSGKRESKKEKEREKKREREREKRGRERRHHAICSLSSLSVMWSGT